MEERNRSRMTARISQIKNTLVVEFPKTNHLDHMKYILRDKKPYFMEIMNIGWIDPKKYNNEEMIRNYYGAFDGEGGSQDFIPLVRLSTLLDKPKIGRSFYGLVEFWELATPSDYLENREIYGTSPEFPSLLSTMLVGKGIILNKGYYHSFPIVKVDELDISNRLEQICENTDINPKDKFKKIKRLLN